MIDKEALEEFLNKEVIITINSGKNLVGFLTNIYESSVKLDNKTYGIAIISLEDISQIRLRETNFRGNGD